MNSGISNVRVGPEKRNQIVPVAATFEMPQLALCVAPPTSFVSHSGEPSVKPGPWAAAGLIRK